MGTSLTGTEIKDTYDSLLKISDNGPISGTAKYLSDGLGNDSALALSTGNIGIGTDSPVTKLSVSDGTNCLHVGYDASGPYISGANNPFTVYKRLSYDATDHVFYSSSAEAMRITSAGNVGIGTSSPSEVLHIKGNQRISAPTGTSVSAVLDLYGNNSNTYGGSNVVRSRIESLTAGDAFGSILKFYTNDSSNALQERVRIDSAGNVGIGTSSPDNGVLTILKNTSNAAEDTYAISIQSFTANAYTELLFGADDTVDAGIIQSAAKGTSFSGKKLALNPNGGNVGIGTTSPNVQLEVSAPDSFAGGIIRLNNNRTALFDGDQNGSIQFSNNEATGGANGVRSAIVSLVRDVSGKTDLVFTTANTSAAATEKVRILAAGGITFNGDTAAANALDDYEEGTWTMGVSFGNSFVGVTYLTNTGTYTKIGRQVTVNGYVALTGIGAATGQARITGLPFTSGTGSQFESPMSLRITAITFADYPMANVNTNATTIDLTQTTNAGVISVLTAANFANNSEIMVSATYFV